jgi:class 3 adenylate cyclase/predicted ATPase
VTELCGGCHREVVAGAQFCSQCGHELQSDPTSTFKTEGERRQLTVVFCDLVGSTELSSRIDAEEFSEQIQDFLDLAVGVAQKYSGEVEHYAGDGILFRFGWPNAHDDDPERAVRAALGILDAVTEAVPSRLAVRIGVHSGNVVIDRMGGAGRTEMMSMGEAVNLASRVHGEAEPNTVVISRSTLELVSGIFVTEPIGMRSLKGIHTPVELHRVIQPSGIRSRLDAAKGRLTPFVGRRGELDALERLWESATRGNGNAMLINGEPGIGKSRLVYQFREQLGHVAHSWLECNCSYYTEDSVLAPVIQLIEQGLQFLREEGPEERLERLRSGLAGFGMVGDEELSLLANLLNLPGTDSVITFSGSSERRRQRTIEVLTDWVIAMSEIQPLIIVVEDLHWSDPTTVQLLEHLQVRCAGSRILLLITARPEFESPWNDDESIAMLELAPFSADDVRQLVNQLSGRRHLPEPVLERIVSDSAGIPLFAEEVGRMVMASNFLIGDGDEWRLLSPLTKLDIPSTLRGTLTARLDRLGMAKAVAQVAAVIDREFSYELLSAISEFPEFLLQTALDHMVNSDLVFQQGNPPHATYVFKHALVQEAAYETLLRRDRRAVHLRIAEELEAMREQSGNATLSVIARHYEEANKLEKACAYYELAARTAVEQSGYREAIALITKGINMLIGLPEGPERDKREIDLQVSLGAAIISAGGYADSGIETAYARARGLCETLGDDELVAEAMTGLSIFYTNRGQIELGAELGQRVLDIGVKNGDHTLELLGRIQMAHPRLYQSQVLETRRHCERALAIYDIEQHRDMTWRFGTDHGVAAHAFAAWSMVLPGMLDSGLAHVNEGVVLAEALGQPFNLVFALAFKATIHWTRGESAEILEAAQRARLIAEEQGFEFWAGIGRVFESAERVISQGDHSRLKDVLQGSMVAGATGNRGGSTPVFARVAEALQAAGDLNAALELVHAALDVSVETRQPFWNAELHRMRAELMLEQIAPIETLTPDDRRELTGVESELDRALMLARGSGFLLHELKILTTRARLGVQMGYPEDVVPDLHAAMTRFSEGLNTPHVVNAREVLEFAGSPM